MEDIKSILDMIAALKLVAIEIKKVMKDGKIDASDLSVLVDLIAQAQVLSTAIAEVKDIPTELKDIQVAEAVAIVQALYGAVAEVQAV